MKVAGLDWATASKDRAIAIIEWDCNKIFIRCIRNNVSDRCIKRLCTDNKLSVVAVDTPFGWPKEFSRFVYSWRPCQQTAMPPCSCNFRYRLTERFVQKKAKLNPLSVSSDRIASSARAWARIVYCRNLFKQISIFKSSENRKLPEIIEVYPAATLSVMGYKAKGYKTGDNTKQAREKAQQTRKEIIEKFCRDFRISQAFSICRTHVPTHALKESGHCLDAFLCAFTALLHKREINGWTVWYPEDCLDVIPEDRREKLKEQIQDEGWIFFPKKKGDRCPVSFFDCRCRKSR